MKKDIRDVLEKIGNNRIRKKRWKRLAAALTFITVFCTTYALIIPAVTMDRPLENQVEAMVESSGILSQEAVDAEVTEDKQDDINKMYDIPLEPLFEKNGVTDYIDLIPDESVAVNDADVSEDEEDVSEDEEREIAGAPEESVPAEKSEAAEVDTEKELDSCDSDPDSKDAADSADEIIEPEEDETNTLEGISSDGAKVVVKGSIPDDAEVTIVPVRMSMNALCGYLGEDTAASVESFAAYDITILSDGVEWQPDDSITVKIISPAVEIDRKDNFEVAHICSDGSAEKMEAKVTKNGDVMFEAEGFSIYILYTYTVDFHYNDFTYSIQGGDSILLSELFEELGIEIDIEKVETVEFSDDSLIKLEKLSSDWRLNSLKAFSSDEELVITLENNETIVIHVTDKPGDGSSNPIEPVPAPDYIGSCPAGIGSTQWQITKYEYTGREQTEKIPVDSDGDGKPDIYIQKNVVPTDVENEFLVYLSADKKVSWEEFLNDSRVGITTSNSYANAPIGKIYNDIHGNVTSELSEHDNQGTYTNRYYVKFNVYQNHNSSTPLYTYYDWRYGTTSECSKATAFMRIPGVGCVVVQQQVNLHRGAGSGTGNPFELDIYLDSLSTDLSYYDTVFNTVTDELGDQVEFMNFVRYDGTYADYDSRTHTITWKPRENTTVIPDLDAPPITGWKENIIQMVYRVRLNVKDEDFISCADTLGNKSASIAAGESFKVNNSAVLNYDMIAIPGTVGMPDRLDNDAEFPIPEVRGLLYNLTFVKLNQNGRQLEGAEFALYESDGTTPVCDADGNPMTLTTAKDSISRFERLPYGTYVLKETKPPAHYEVPSQNTWTVKLCYTDSSRTLLQQDVSPYEHFMRYKGNDTNGQWRIVNTKKAFHYSLKVIKTDRDGNSLSGAGFSIADPDNAGQSLSQRTEEDGTCSFNAAFKPGVEYELSEFSPPGGYLGLPAGIKFKVEENDDDDTYTAVLINGDDFDGKVSIKLKETDSGETVLEVTVHNESINELPDTGGSGTLIYTLGGLLIILSALMTGFVIRGKRGRRSEI